MTAANSNILLCACVYAEVIPQGVRETVLAAIPAAAADVHVIPDLCALAERQAPLLRALAAKPELRVLACHPRAVHWLFHAAGAPLRDDAEVLDVRRQAPQEIVKRLGYATPGTKNVVALPAPEPGAWLPWFPVIDQERCCNCKQCLSFCLFGVYAETVESRVEVRHPRHCKTHCPACARVCPKAAIIFPKCPEPLISGDVPAEGDAPAGNVQVDLDRLMGDDALSALAARRRRHGKRLLRDAVGGVHSTPPAAAVGMEKRAGAGEKEGQGTGVVGQDP